ncbi:MAG: tryptophan synthase subunit alpha [Alphaproteobacteria bacterium]
MTARSRATAHADAGGRLARRFAMLRERDEAAFVPFVMSGDRGLDTTARLLDELVEAGADVIELGVPFSDPMADGPVLQRAATRAIEAGTTLARVLELVVEFRHRSDVPIVLFGYANPFFRYGPARLAEAAAKAGVDAILCVDTPPEEADELRLPLQANGLDMIFLLAPTSTPARIRRVLSVASGFVYFVSVAGVTGVKTADPHAIEKLVGRIRRQSPVPVGVGFGISTPDQARALSGFSDAVIVGSHFSKLFEDAPDDDSAVREVVRSARELKAATRRRPSP